MEPNVSLDVLMISLDVDDARTTTKYVRWWDLQ